MRLKLLLIFFLFDFGLEVFAQCGPTVPTFTVDLTGSPGGSWTSPFVQRNGNCCGTTAPDKCVDFVITLDAAAVGITFDIIDGAVPGGALFYQINCGPPQPLGSPICLSGVGPHLLTFCKPGNNENVYQITSIPPAIGGTNLTVNDGCIDTLNATGFNDTTVTWNSIYPGASGAYNGLLSCTTGCTDPIVTGAGTLPPYIDYVVCGQPASLCNFATICDTVRVTFNPTLFVTIAPINPTICFGQTSTTITATGAGGTIPYSYLWNSVNPSASINVGTGTYTVQLSDASGCPPTYASVTVTSFSVTITANAGLDDTVCTQSPTATLNGSVTGASGGIWSGGAGTYSPNNATLTASYTPTAAEIAAGFVNLTLTTTGNGTCPSASDVVRINYLGFIGTVSVTPTHVSCFGGNNGTAAVSITGGLPPHTYLWNTVPAQTTATATNLPQGTYTVTMTNGIGCASQTSVTITQPTPLAVSGVITNVSCAGGNNGSVAVTPSGGTPPYTYSWLPGGQTTSSITGQIAGTYTVTVTDSKGCVLTTNYTITQPLPLAVTITRTNVSCFGGSDGTATTTVTGGTPAFTYSWSPSGGTAPNASGLIAGTYTVTVTDSKGCVATNSIVITQPTVVVASPTVTNETCNYLNNGTAAANTSGGTPGYTYLWMPGSMTTSSVTGLSSGTYTLTVTDSKGCPVTVFATITEPAPLIVSLINQVNVSCFAGSDGAVTASPSGGTPAYTYSWTPGGSTSATLSGVAAGTYSVTVTDNNGCTIQNQTTITQPLAPVSVTNVITNVSCAGGSDGSIAVTPAGGTGPYTFAWMPGGQTTGTISGQAAGTYTVTVTDSKGCVLVTNHTITQPLPLGITFTQTNVSCFNGSDGTATATVTGGTPAYLYNWSPSGGSGPIASGLIAGTYTVTITDSKGCIATNSVTITQPPILVVAPTVTNETCDYLNNGTAAANPSGGTPGYTYSWMPGGMTTSSVNGLIAGTYTVTVTDAEGCITSATALITEPLPLAISFHSQVNVSCFGGSDGIVAATPSGGTPNYSYLWMPGGATTNTASGLSAGTYTLTITDNNGCTFQNTVTITEPIVLSVSSVITNVSCNGGSDGTITATPADGTGPYTYQWLPGGQTTQSISGQVAGTYTVNVTDANGCLVTATYTITQPLQLAIAFTTVNVSCFNGSNGSINSTVSGGTIPYAYSWNPTGAVTPNVTGLIAGTYTLTVTDGLGCIFSSSATITQPTIVSVSTTVVNETCDYLNNGSATATGAGGTPGYTYLWQPGSLATATITNQASGTYTVTASDSQGCTATTTAIITEPTPLAITFSGQIDVSCFGGNDGSISATPSGGTPNYSYSWMPGGATTNSVSGLTAGTYTLTITDLNGCTFQSSVTIAQPLAPLSIAMSSLPTNCFGGSDGSATANASGGTGPYAYNWMPGSIGTQNISGVPAGTYTVTATDSKGCITTNTVVVSQPSQIILTTSTVNSNCGTASGQASVVVSGGFAPYTYSWSPTGGTGPTATGLLATPYTVTVTDAQGCIETQWANVNDNSGPSATIFNVINVSCFGGNDGEASVGVAGGTGPFVYNWTPYGGSTVTADSLVAGTYTVTVVDANGCQSNATTSPDIIEPPPIVISIITSAVSCFGGSDGTASANATGGTPGYTYQWLPGGTMGPNVTNLTANTFTVQVTDANSCIQTEPYTITEPVAALSVAVSSTPVSCNAGSNGTVAAVAAGGTGPYNYSWMPGSYTGQNISGLPVGTYTVTAVDANGCSTTNSVTVTQPTPIVLVTSSVNSNCSLPNGQASVSTSGGTPSYIFQWSPSGGTDSIANGLLFGPYTVTVTDANGCIATASTTVIDNAGPAVTAVTVTNVSCFAGSDGTATATVTGAGPFSYAWSPSGGITATETGLPAGTYTVVATDINGCASASATSPAITQPSIIIINVSTSNVSCLGGNNGSATVSAFGGTPGYTYLWLPGGTTGATVTNLSANTYTVQVTDLNSCVQTATYTITEPVAALAVSASSLPVSCFGGSNGSASSLASGGTSPYNYSWMPGSISGQNISGLPIGTYTVTATDLNGCTATNSTTVIQPTALSLVTGSSNASCGTASGVGYVTASGGTLSYSYAWSPVGGINDTASAVPPGSYTVTVTDGNSCVTTASLSVNNNPGPIASVISTTNVSCFGGSNGTATSGVSSGSAPFIYSWAPLGGSAPVATGLPTGTYTVTITDANGCISSATSPLITQPTLVNVNTTTTDVSCFAGNNGTATASAGGGTPGYTYQWLPSGSSGTAISGLTAGTYTVQATDANSCIQTNTFTINEPAVLTATITASSNVSCFGDSNGSAVVSANGGTPFYTYNWMPSGGMNDTASGLSAGTYTVTVTDTKGCSSTASVSITQPAQALSATATGSSTSCFGGADGTASVVASGGTPAYDYLWSPVGGTAANASGLSFGNYTVLVTDDNGCQTNASVSITQPTIISDSLVTVNPSCGFNNGSVTSLVSGGTGPYSYSWSPGGAVTPDISSVGPGTYNLQITDANGCVSNIAATLTNIAGPAASISSQTNVSCFGGNNGNATVSIVSGTPPYIISWSPFGGSGITGTGFTIGTYTVTVTDALGCISTATTTITEPTPLGISVSSLVPVSCNGGSNGSITVTGTGGTTPYSYSWSPVVSSLPTVSSLSAGTYTVNVSDQNGCATSISITVTEPSTLIASSGTVVSPTCYNSTNGSATANVTGGTIPYSYLWSNGQTGSTAISLTAGGYTVTVTDANSCTSTTSLVITQPTPVITAGGPNDTICLGSSGTVTATASGGVGNYYYVWQPGPAINAGTFNITPTVTTDYIVVAYDEDGCPGTPDTVAAIVYDLTAANIDAIAYTPICPGQSSPVYVQTIGVTGPLTFTWDNGLGTGPGAFIVVPTVPTTYIVTATNSCGSTISDSVQITFNPPPTLVLSSDTNGVCIPDVVQFNDYSITGNVVDPITSWYWNFGDGTFSTLQNPAHIYPSVGTFLVSLTVTTSAGCTNNNASAPMVINAYPYPIAAFTQNSTILDLPYDPLILTNQSVGATTYLWNFGDGGSSTAMNPTYLYSSVGIYPIQLISTSTFGCSDTAYSEVTTTADVVFPNVFTPDPNGGSGGFYDITSLTNDVFFPYTSGVTEFKLQIFNRWGELIFETFDIKQGWDGYYRGQMCQQDVYIWKASLKLNNGKTFNKTGDVTLLR
jgi:gliding motility-associated-like protein